MANVMSMADVKNRPSRSGFDLSRKNLFTAKVGECLPVAVLECLPGDKHTLKLKWMTRTQPLNTAAYTRIKEYYNWYYVPTNLLWNKFDDFVMGQVNNNMKADSINQSTRLSDQHPYVTLSQIWTYVNTMATNKRKNFFGYSRAELTCKLLDFLGYGDFYGALTSATFPANVKNAVVNLFPLLAYQKIYQDHIRNSQWERAYAPACNINYISGSSSSLNIPLNNIDMDVDNMFDLRYCNWNKDYFMGLLPKQQFGDTASVMALDGATVAFTSPELPDDGNAIRVGYRDTLNKFFTLKTSDTNANELQLSKYSQLFSILSLRQAEAVQKMREIMQCHEQDYKSQVEARWNVKVSASKSDRCQWLGGDSSGIDINEVVNNNFESTDSTANIKGKGVSVGDGYQECNTLVHGYLICIYHAQPVLDFAIQGVKKHNLKTYFTDYAQPELDKTGMVAMNMVELFNSNSAVPPSQLGTLLGYAPQYYEYKTAYDEVHGAFNYDSAGFTAWTAPLGNYYLRSYFQTIYTAGFKDNPITYHFFKVYPSVLDPIMSLSADSSLQTDQLLVNSYFDIKSARNLDYNGLPY